MLGGINDEGYIGTNTWKDEYYCLDNGYIRAYDWCDSIKFTLEEFLNKYPYKVGDKVNQPCRGCVKTITSMKWDEYLNTVSYKLDNKIYTRIEQLKVVNDLPYKEEVNMKDNKLFGTVSNPVETKSYTVGLKDGKVIDNSIDASQFMQIDKTVAVCFNTENYENEVELKLGDYEIVVRDGKTYAVLKKPKYPTTYEECCEIIHSDPNFYIDTHLYSGTLDALYKLLICRTAYWKIAGEQMGLDKPWEPAIQDTIWGITRSKDEVEKYSCHYGKTNLLEFPTEEMRDVFLNNFKDLIEECKELL